MRRALLLLAVLAVANAAPAESAVPPPVVITTVAPLTAPPAGGSFVAVSGHGFAPPVRVFFEFEDATLETLTVSVSHSRIELITPAVAFGTDEQMRVARLTVESRGHRVTSREPFVFENLILEPKISGISPRSGSRSGGTFITIFGDGFQAPVQVRFGEAEARVIHVTRTQLVAESPPGPDFRSVGITVRNIASQTEHTLPHAFEYIPEVAISSVTPDHGRAGTDITISGEGFVAPVLVTVAGIPALVLQVTRTKIVARTQPASTCGPLTGPVVVLNVDNGGMASGLRFTYEAAPVEIVAVHPRNAVAGRTVDVQLAHEADYAFAIGGVRAEIVARHGVTYRLRIPTTLTFPMGACMLRGIEGTGPVESRFSVHVLDRRGNCTTTRRSALTIAPAAPVGCTLPPRVTVLPRTCSSRTVTIANERGRADLVITAPESVSPRTATIRGGETKQLTLPAAAQLERLRFETNDPRNPWLLVCVSP